MDRGFKKYYANISITKKISQHLTLESVNKIISNIESWILLANTSE